MVGTGVTQKHIATGSGHGAQKGARFDAVCHHFVFAPLQTLYPLDVNATGAMAFDLGAHGNEHFCQIGNFRFLCSVFQHRFAFGQRCSHQKVFGAGDSHHVGGNACALQACARVFQLGHHVAVFHLDVSTHGLQAFDVLIDWSRANGTSARQGHFGMAKTRQQRAQSQHRGAHGFDQLVGSFGVVQTTGI